MYILKDKKVVPTENFSEFTEFFRNEDNKIVKQQYIGDILISTVFLGIDHGGYLTNGQPIVFETMIFKDDDFEDLYCSRYVNYEDALRGHRHAVRLVIQKIRNKECPQQ